MLLLSFYYLFFSCYRAIPGDRSDPNWSQLLLPCAQQWVHSRPQGEALSHTINTSGRTEIDTLEQWVDWHSNYCREWDRARSYYSSGAYNDGRAAHPLTGITWTHPLAIHCSLKTRTRIEPTGGAELYTSHTTHHPSFSHMPHPTHLRYSQGWIWAFRETTLLWKFGMQRCVCVCVCVWRVACVCVCVCVWRVYCPNCLIE